ncbi:DUF2666 family protein [Candidatus Micrarchaeota archaeon]|nr:DUF2666 family protein [Candidatus Micrarchaeota archaeon]
MEGGDELIFTGQYKDFRLGIRFDLSGKEPKDAAAALAYISERIEPAAFASSGIDTKKVEDFAALDGKGVGAVVAFLEMNTTGAIREKLGSAMNNPDLMSVAECYLLNQLLMKAGVAFKVAPSPAVVPKEEKIEDFIGFIGNYKGWIAIKKLGLENVQDYEVSGILSGINHTIVNKAFDFAGMKNDALVGSVASGKRKSYGNLGAALRGLEGKLTGGADDAYVVCKVCENVGYKPYASPEMLTNAYPDIKPPKVKGRKPKG